MTTDQSHVELRTQAQRWFIEPELFEISTVYDHRETRMSAATLIELALREMHRFPRSVLEVGCGPGDVLALLGQRLPEAWLYGLDPSEEALHRARAVLAASDRCELRSGSADELDAPQHSDLHGAVDLALVHLSIGLWPERARGLVAMANTLADGGVAYVLDMLTPLDQSARGEMLAFARNQHEARFLEDQMRVWLAPAEAEELAWTVQSALPNLSCELRFSRLHDLSRCYPANTATQRPSPPEVLHLVLRRDSGADGQS